MTKRWVMCCLAVLAGFPSWGLEMTIPENGLSAVREQVHFELAAGENQLVHEVTSLTEPGSVYLKPIAGSWRLIEQQYEDANYLPHELIRLNKGRQVKFSAVEGQDLAKPGTIMQAPLQDGGPALIDSNGLFFVKPTSITYEPISDTKCWAPHLTWRMHAENAGPADAELTYMTHGLKWEVSYVLTVTPGSADLIAWHNIENKSGKSFEKASLKVMAGSTGAEKPDPVQGRWPAVQQYAQARHVYPVAGLVSLPDGSLKQVEFFRATGIPATIAYECRSTQSVEPNPMPQNEAAPAEYPPVNLLIILTNTKETGLGLELPKGKVRSYRNDRTSLGAIDESTFEGASAGEPVELLAGPASDVKVARVRKQVTSDESRRQTEAYELTVSTSASEPVVVRLVESIAWRQWEVIEPSNTFLKKDSNTIEFRVQAKPGEATVVSYKVRQLGY